MSTEEDLISRNREPINEKFCKCFPAPHVYGRGFNFQNREPINEKFCL
jgi:hypothetical protein